MWCTWWQVRNRGGKSERDESDKNSICGILCSRERASERGGGQFGDTIQLIVFLRHHHTFFLILYISHRALLWALLLYFLISFFSLSLPLVASHCLGVGALKMYQSRSVLLLLYPALLAVWLLLQRASLIRRTVCLFFLSLILKPEVDSVFTKRKFCFLN